MVLDPDRKVVAETAGLQLVLDAIRVAARAFDRTAIDNRRLAAVDMLGSDQALELIARLDVGEGGYVQDLAGVAFPLDMVALDVPDVRRLLDRG